MGQTLKKNIIGVRKENLGERRHYIKTGVNRNEGQRMKIK